MDSEELFKNFAMFIPESFATHPDGTPVTYVNPEDRKLFTEYLLKNNIDLGALSGFDREQLFKEWKAKQ